MWAMQWVDGSQAAARWAAVRQAIGAQAEGGDIERLTADAYERLFQSIDAAGDWHAVRIWNFVPSLLADAGDGLNRYMRFNAGRHRAFARRLGCERRFDELLPAASAVGTGGDELIIHALLLPSPGMAVQNPRQRPPHRYSRRFGPLPPCFARATRIESTPIGRALLVGGTASVVGEDSLHRGALELQLQETLENLAAVERAAFGPTERGPLSGFRELRVYHPRADDEHAILALLGESFPNLWRIECVLADLCRAELLVEIEGLVA